MEHVDPAVMEQVDPAVIEHDPAVIEPVDPPVIEPSPPGCRSAGQIIRSSMETTPTSAAGSSQRELGTRKNAPRM